MLSTLVMEVLSALIRKTDEWSLLRDLGIRGLVHGASLYADDLVVFISPMDKDLDTMAQIFWIFQSTFGLACNL